MQKEIIDDEVIAVFMNIKEKNKSENDSDQEGNISHAEGNDALETGLRYVEHVTSTPADALNLKR